MAQAEPLGRERHQRARAAALAHQHGLVMVEPVLGDELLDHGNDLVGGALEDLARRVLDRHAEQNGERRDRGAGRIGVAEGVHAGLGVTERIGGAGRGDRIARAVAAPDRDMVGRLARPRLEQLDRRAVEYFGIGEGGIGQPAMWALRGPTSTSLPSATRTRLPPAMPSTRTSSELT